MSDASPEPETQRFVPVAPEPESPATAPTQAVPGAPVRGGTSRMPGSGWVNVALALAIAVAIGGIGFAAGRMTAPTSVAGASGGRTFAGGQLPGGQAPGGQAPGGQAPGGQAPGGSLGGGAFRGGFPGGDDGGLRSISGASGVSIQGTVESISGGALTLKLASGQTVQISLSGTTTYHSEATASSSDVQTGGTVIVRLQLNRGQDGGTGTTSPTATDVTIVP